MAFSKSLLLLKEHFGAYRHFFFGRGKGEKFPCFQCGKWKICKLIEGKNQEKVQNPKGNAFSFLFQAALSLWLCVGAVERKLSLQMGSLWLWGCCCQGEGDTGHGVTRGGCGTRPRAAAPSGPHTLPAAGSPWRVTPAAPWDALGRLGTRPHHPWGHCWDLEGQRLFPYPSTIPKPDPCRFGLPRESFTPLGVCI